MHELLMMCHISHRDPVILTDHLRGTHKSELQNQMGIVWIDSSGYCWVCPQRGGGGYTVVNGEELVGCTVRALTRNAVLMAEVHHVQ